MDNETLSKLRLFEVELKRWKWYLQHEMNTSDLPDFIKADMNIEQLLEFVLKNNEDVSLDDNEGRSD